MSKKIYGVTVGTNMNPQSVKPDMSEYVKKTDYATKDKCGVIRAYPTNDKDVPGVGLSGNNILGIVRATDTEIEGQTNTVKPIVPSNLSYAVMKALSDSKLEWTDEQKASALELLGVPSGNGVLVSDGAKKSFIPWAYNKAGNSIVRRLGNGSIECDMSDSDTCATNKKYVDGLVSQHDIITKASGEVIATTDSAKAKPNIKLFGKSKQDGTPSMETPIEAVSHGESGSIGGKVLTGNLFDDVTCFESQGFTKNGDYWEGSGALRLLYTNYKGINGSLVIEYDYISLASVNVFIMEIHYTDGTTEIIGNWKQNEWVHNRIVTNQNKTVDYINRTFVDRGNFYVKNFMISTDGKPYEPYSEQPFTFQTPNGLRGIPLGQTIPDAIKNSPIHMNGVYWDSVEQQYYIADTENEDGKDVQRIIELVYDGSESWGTYDSVGLEGFYVDKLPFADYRRHGLCNQFKVKSPTDETGNTGIWLGVHSNLLYAYRNSFYDESLADKGMANFKAHLNENPLKIWTWLDEPIVTESDAQYDVVMNYPNTTIVNDEGAYMEVEYVADTKCYVDNKFKELEANITSAIAQLL